MAGKTVRCGWVLPRREELAALRDWPVGAIETIRQVQHQPGTHVEIRCYLTSCCDAPAVPTAAIRRYWALENSLHWVLDGVCREDEAPSRARVATRSFAGLRKRAFNLLQQGRPPTRFHLHTSTA